MSSHIIYTGGTFDVPHIGHYNFLKQCKELFPDSKLIVSLNRDEFIERYKGRKPLFSYQEREYFLRLCPYVDEVIENIGDEDSKPAILKSDADIIVIGSDWLSKDYCKQMNFTPEWLVEFGISLVYLPYTLGISTTEIKRRILTHV